MPPESASRCEVRKAVSGARCSPDCAKGSDSAAVVEFTGKVQRMARVHQYGLKDRPNRNSREVQYEARPLLGFTRDDEQMIEDVILSHLGK